MKISEIFSHAFPLVLSQQVKRLSSHLNVKEGCGYCIQLLKNPIYMVNYSYIKQFHKQLRIQNWKNYSFSTCLQMKI